jgi:hypothetical protein
MSAEESQTHTTQEEQSVPGDAELDAYAVDAEGTAANGTTRSTQQQQRLGAEAQLPTPPFKRRRAVALARVLSRVLPCDDIEILELPLFQRFFDTLVQHAKAFFMDTFKDMCRCDRKAVEGVIEKEECKVKWNGIYTREREAIKQEPHYPAFIQTVSEWERRLPALPKPEQSTPDLPMAYYHATHVKENFRELLEGIKEKLPDTILSGPALKHPYRTLEKMALEESDRKWTARCVMDLLRGAIDCRDTREMNRVLMFLDACTLDVREGIRSNDYEGLVSALPTIRIMRVKNRFENSTKGGWADISINFVFVNGPNQHVQELQLQHRELVLIRKGWGEDARYAGLRVLAEFLQSVPTAVDGDAKQELGW